MTGKGGIAGGWVDLAFGLIRTGCAGYELGRGCPKM